VSDDEREEQDPRFYDASMLKNLGKDWKVIQDTIINYSHKKSLKRIMATDLMVKRCTIC